MIAPMNSLGARIVARTMGSRISATLPDGNSEGFVTSTTVRSSSVTEYSTLGDVEMRSSPNSRSSRSRTISRWSRPRNPHRKPNPRAAEVSGS